LYVIEHAPVLATDQPLLTLSFETGAPERVAGAVVNEWRDDRGERVATGHRLDHRCWIVWQGHGVFAFSVGSGDVRVWTDRPPADVAHAFERVLQPVVLQAMDWEVLHAGAAVGPAGLVAFCGRSGVGKSTLSFAMEHKGWQQLADDSLVFRIEEGAARAYPLPFARRLRPASLAYFTRMGFDPAGPIRPARCRVHSLAAVFLLCPDSSVPVPRVSPLGGTQAFSELLSHAHCFDPEDRSQARRLVENYSALAAQVPVVRLHYRPDLEQLAGLAETVAAASSAKSAGEGFGRSLT
jgi:hypothetical protein